MNPHGEGAGRASFERPDSRSVFRTRRHAGHDHPYSAPQSRTIAKLYNFDIILDRIGEGGMGVVYKAEHTKLDRTVALKFLSAHLLDNDGARERFVREDKAAATLDRYVDRSCTLMAVEVIVNASRRAPQRS